MIFLNRFFFNREKFKFKPSVATNILAMCYSAVLPKTQAINYLSIVLKRMLELVRVNQFAVHTSSPKLNKFCK